MSASTSCGHASGWAVDCNGPLSDLCSAANIGASANDRSRTTITVIGFADLQGGRLTMAHHCSVATPLAAKLVTAPAG
jgi:hypothetical protein